MRARIIVALAMILFSFTASARLLSPSGGASGLLLLVLGNDSRSIALTDDSGAHYLAPQ